MALNAKLPDDSTLISRLDDFARETRKYINSLESVVLQETFTVTNLIVSRGVLNVASEHLDPEYADLSDVNLELVVASAASPISLSAMYYGYEGQIKVFLMNTDNLTFLNEDTSEGYFDLSVADSFEPAMGDVIAFVNMEGDGGETKHGYWKELFRSFRAARS